MKVMLNAGGILNLARTVDLNEFVVDACGDGLMEGVTAGAR